jgi:heat shock protein HtpX
MSDTAAATPENTPISGAGSLYNNPNYRFQWPVSFLDRIRQNKRNSKLLFVIFLLVNMVTFALYGAAAVLIIMGLIGFLPQGSQGASGAMIADAIVTAFRVGLPIGALVGVIITLFGAVRAFDHDGSDFIRKVNAVEIPSSGGMPNLVAFRNAVENMSIAGGMPKARAFVMESPTMNAFSVGDKHANGCVVATTALLGNLTSAEIEGVVGHEMSHIYDRDSLLMGVALTLAGAALALPSGAGRIYFFGGRGGGRNSGNGILLIIGILLAVITFIISRIVTSVLKAFLSQEREYLADATSAKMTRNPRELASALAKIAGSDASGLPDSLNSLEALFIVTPIDKSRKLHALFNTHPPIEERIRRLMAM